MKSLEIENLSFLRVKEKKQEEKIKKEKKQEEKIKKEKKQEDVEDNSLYFIFKNIKNKAGKGIEPISTTDYVVALPLSYPAKIMEMGGFDPPTSRMQSERSNQLIYIPK